jgi:hypothetical protein
MRPGDKMVNIHNTVGTLVVVLFLALTIINVLRVTGRTIPIARPLSYVAALLLFVQIALGIGLLSSGAEITPLHYILGLLAIITVGAEHGYAGRRPSPELQAMAALLATGATTILVTAAHIIGSSS